MQASLLHFTPNVHALNKARLEIITHISSNTPSPIPRSDLGRVATTTDIGGGTIALNVSAVDMTSRTPLLLAILHPSREPATNRWLGYLGV